MSFFEAFLLGIVEGITEFLPISSTGHMVIVSHWLGLAENQFTKNFEVIVQFGAILSVIYLYRKKFTQSMDFYKRIFIAFLPTGIIGFFLKKQVDLWLENIWIVIISLFLGGIILVWSDKKFSHLKDQGRDEKNLNYKECIYLGLFQSIAMIPGVSRSASTILGGLFQGLSRKAATEFSFFLAVPTMAAATLYKVYKVYPTITTDQLSTLSVGFIVSFIVAMIAIKTFIKYVSSHGFKYFGYYRIILSLIIFGVLVCPLKF